MNRYLITKLQKKIKYKTDNSFACFHKLGLNFLYQSALYSKNTLTNQIFELYFANTYTIYIEYKDTTYTPNCQITITQNITSRIK